MAFGRKAEPAALQDVVKLALNIKVFKPSLAGRHPDTAFGIGCRKVGSIKNSIASLFQDLPLAILPFGESVEVAIFKSVNIVFAIGSIWLSPQREQLTVGQSEQMRHL